MHQSHGRYHVLLMLPGFQLMSRYVKSWLTLSLPLLIFATLQCDLKTFFESLFILNLHCARTMVNLIWLSFFCIMLTEKFVASRYVWCSGQHYYTTSFNKVWIHFLHRFQSFSPRVRGFLLWESLTMVPAGNKAKRLLSVKHSRNNTLSSSSRSQLVTKETIKIESIKHWSRHYDIVS